MFAQWDDHEVTNDWWPGQTRADYGNANASLLAARGCRAFHEFMPMRETPAEHRPHLSQDRLRPAARRVHARHAQLSRAERPRQATRRQSGRASSSGRSRSHGSSASCGLARDLEGDRRRPAARARQRRRGRAGRRAAARPRARDRRPAVLHQARRRPQHGLDHRRHALHGRALLRSRTARRSRTSSRSGSSCPARSTPAPGGRASSTTRSARARCSRRAARREQGENLAPCFGLQFFGHVAIDGATEVMTVTLKDVGDRDLWSTRIEPKLRWTNAPVRHAASSFLYPAFGRESGIQAFWLQYDSSCWPPRVRPGSADRRGPNPMRLLHWPVPSPSLPQRRLTRRPSIRSTAPKSCGRALRLQGRVRRPARAGPGQGDGERRRCRGDVRQGGELHRARGRQGPVGAHPARRDAVEARHLSHPRQRRHPHPRGDLDRLRHRAAAGQRT